ncbi:MAG: ATP-binding protein [Chloroflexota bacterium]
MSERLGIVFRGSLTEGVDVRLDNSASVEDMVVGRHIVIEGKKQRFFGMITDISLGVTDPAISADPPDGSDSFLTEVLSGTATFGTIHVLPMLGVDSSQEVAPVKTVPSHFSPVRLADEADTELIFGKEGFPIGNPLDMETRLRLNLEEFVKRSNGIFGKSGTGKTFLTRILLIGMLQKSRAVNLIFDMHNEYGWMGTSEGEKRQVKGLKQLFPSRVAVFSLDEKNSRQRGVSPDFVVRIGYDEIEPEDIAILQETLNLTDPAVEAVYQLRRHFGREWLSRSAGLTESEDTDNLLKGLNIHESTFQNLKRGLNTIVRMPFMEAKASADAVGAILEYLERGMNVVLEFGRYRDITAYILVANLLSRRIYARYQEMTERAMGEGTGSPRPLVITIEEAHKFLSPEVSGRTIFGTIAREMRKYNVTLLVIDQRPSGISDEVMSQLGTKITCLLDNERDVDAVLSGVSGRNELRSVLSRLASRRQALIFGHAVPMPVAFQVREYGSPESYKELASGQEIASSEPKEGRLEDLWR